MMNPVCYLKQKVKYIVSIKQTFLCQMCVKVNSGIVIMPYLLLVSKMVVGVWAGSFNLSLIASMFA